MRTGRKGFRRVVAWVCSLALCASMMPAAVFAEGPETTPEPTPVVETNVSEEPSPAPSEEPAGEPSPEPSTSPAPSEEPTETPSPTSSEEPAEEPSPAPSEEEEKDPAAEPGQDGAEEADGPKASGQEPANGEDPAPENDAANTPPAAENGSQISNSGEGNMPATEEASESSMLASVLAAQQGKTEEGILSGLPINPLVSSAEDVENEAPAINQVQPLAEPGNGEVESPAMATYVATDSTVSNEPVTLDAAIEALNGHGGGTATVVSSGTVPAGGIDIESQITITAETPVTVCFPQGESYYGDMFYIRRNTTGGQNTLILGEDDLKDGMLTFDISNAKAEGYSSIISASNINTDDVNDTSILYIQDGVVLTGAHYAVVDTTYNSGDFTVKMSGGLITDNRTRDSVISSSHFIMTGGKIANNTVDESTSIMSRGIIQVLGSFDIKGDAVIENCNGGTYGPIVCPVAAKETSYLRGNAVIRNCTGMMAGAIVSDAGDGFTVILEDDAQILNCTQTYEGEGANILNPYAGAIYSTDHLTIQDNALISGCSGYAGAVGISGSIWGEEDAILLTIDGNAKITDNKGTFGGGALIGIYVNATVQGNAEISKNEAAQAGGGIMIYNVLQMGRTPVPTFTLKGGRVTENSAPRGGGVFVSGTKQVYEFLGVEFDGEIGEPCVINMQDGAVITGNTAAEQGGGVWLGWEVNSYLSGKVTVQNNTANGAANDLYLALDPDAPIPDGSSQERPTLAAFVDSYVAALVQETISDMTDEDYLELAKSYDFVSEDTEIRDLAPDEWAEVKELVREALTVTSKISFLLEPSKDNQGALLEYQAQYGVAPTLDDFKDAVYSVYREQFEVVITQSIRELGGFDPKKEEIVTAAEFLGLPVKDGVYTGSEEEFYSAYAEYATNSQLEEVAEEDWQSAFSEASDGALTATRYDARVEITGALTGSQIGVFVEGPRIERVFAFGDTYAPTDADLAVFTVENVPYTSGRGLLNNNTFVLKEVDAPAAGSDDSHHHDYTWQHSPDEHWQYCSGCGQAVSNGPHTFQWKDGYQECTVCGYRVTAAQSGTAAASNAAPAAAANVPGNAAANVPGNAAAPAAVSGAIPQTGDEMPVGALTALAAAAAAAFVALLVVRKRRHGKD